MKDRLYYFWLGIGVRAGWIGYPYCTTHDDNSEYMTEEEKEEWEDGGDPCHIAITVLNS